MAQGVARNVNAAALEDALLPVKREVVGVFSDDEVGDEIETGEAAKEWGGRCGGENGCLLWFVFEANFSPLDDLTNATGGLVVEQLGDLVPNHFVALGVGFVFGGKFSAFFDG